MGLWLGWGGRVRISRSFSDSVINFLAGVASVFLSYYPVCKIAGPKALQFMSSFQ